MAAQFRILGAVEALLDGTPASLGAPKQRAVLAMLLVNRRRVVSADQLVDGLWGEEPPASAVQSLQVYVHGLRRALADARRGLCGAPRGGSAGGQRPRRGTRRSLGSA